MRKKTPTRKTSPEVLEAQRVRNAARILVVKEILLSYQWHFKEWTSEQMRYDLRGRHIRDGFQPSPRMKFKHKQVRATVGALSTLFYKTLSGGGVEVIALIPSKEVDRIETMAKNIWMIESQLPQKASDILAMGYADMGTFKEAGHRVDTAVWITHKGDVYTGCFAGAVIHKRFHVEMKRMFDINKTSRTGPTIGHPLAMAEQELISYSDARKLTALSEFVGGFYLEGCTMLNMDPTFAERLKEKVGMPPRYRDDPEKFMEFMHVMLLKLGEMGQ